MELRIFFQPSIIPFDLSQKLAAFSRAPVEKRVDTYLDLKDDALGLKYRSKKRLEFKVRSSRLESGLENWHKVISTHMESNKKRDVINLLQRYETAVQPELSPHVARCATLLNHVKRSNISLNLHKRRKQTSVSLQDLGSTTNQQQRVIIEQTEISLTGDSESTWTWRSICVEGSVAETVHEAMNLIKKEMTQTSEKLHDHIWTVGYPAFVTRLRETTPQPSSTS